MTHHVRSETAQSLNDLCHKIGSKGFLRNRSLRRIPFIAVRTVPGPRSPRSDRCRAER